jgi:hypothetical protein
MDRVGVYRLFGITTLLVGVVVANLYLLDWLESLAPVPETMMDVRNIDELNKPTAKAVIKGWVLRANKA